MRSNRKTNKTNLEKNSVDSAFVLRAFSGMQHTARCIKKATPKSSLHHVPSPNTRWLCNPASYSPQLTTPL
jgi:hypothetical protein